MIILTMKSYRGNRYRLNIPKFGTSGRSVPALWVHRYFINMTINDLFKVENRIN